jgi:23S rRNA (guanosine2251-2'-O)-methyltransferase
VDESERSEPSSNEPEMPSDPPAPPRGELDNAQPQGQPLGDGDANRRRRRGRRGRGGGFGGPRPPFTQRPQYGGPRPQYGAQPFRPQPQGGREEDEQSRELAAYERRMRQRGGGGPQGWRGGPPRQSGGWRQRSGAGQQRYQDTIRRVTAGPRTTAPSHQPAGEPIAGPHAILEAIRAGRTIRRLYVSEDRGTRTGAVNELITEAQQRRIFVRFVDKMEIGRLSPIEEHQGVVAIVEGKTGVELDELLLHLDTLGDPALVLIIDSLQDPQNFGVLLRSAEGAGVDGVVIPHHRAVGLTPAVAKTSAGASEHLLVADVANLRQAIDAIKEKGVWVVGTDESGDLLYDEVDYRGPTAIVVGGEGEGIRRLVLEGCDQVVRIPMQGQVSSLNAAAAGTVLLYEALRQRRRNEPPAQTRTPRPVVEDADAPTVDEPAKEAPPLEQPSAEVSPESAEPEAPEAITPEAASNDAKKAPRKRAKRPAK